MDDDACALVTIGDASKNEGRRDYTPIDFTVTLSKRAARRSTVEYSTADGTAKTDANDYYATYGTLYFEPGMTSAIINTSIRGDTQREPNETFFVNLVNAVDADDFGIAQGQGTIVNDDGTTPAPLPLISIGNAEVVEGNSGTQQMTFTVSLSAASTQEVRVKYATANGIGQNGRQRLSGRVWHRSLRSRGNLQDHHDQRQGGHETGNQRVLHGKAFQRSEWRDRRRPGSGNDPE